MSTYSYGPALDSEIGYRREGLLRDATATRLARIARRSRRADRRADSVLRTVAAPVRTGSRTTAGAPAEATRTTAGAAGQAAGTAVGAATKEAADQVVRAA